jgi:hypothetical protein
MVEGWFVFSFSLNRAAYTTRRFRQRFIFGGGGGQLQEFLGDIAQVEGLASADMLGVLTCGETCQKLESDADFRKSIQ